MASFENRVDNYLRDKLKIFTDRNVYEKHDLPRDIKECFKEASKAGYGQGEPDFLIMADGVPVVFENKYGLNFLEKTNKQVFSEAKNAIKDFAVNGALHYGSFLLDKYEQVYVMGLVGEGLESELEVKYRMFLMIKGVEPKEIHIKSLEVFHSENFESFHKENQLTEEEKHNLLEKSIIDLQKKAKDLNKLMNDNAITVANRIVYVSGCLLACENGLEASDLLGNKTGRRTDGKIVYNHIADYLEQAEIPASKVKMMLTLYNMLNVDTDYDKPIRPVKKGKKDDEQMYISINKEIFTYIKEEIYDTIQDKSHLDTMGSLYSEFLKFAVGDGKDNGIVLTPPYVTKLMTRLIDINADDKVIDLCLGSAGFLVAAMATMLEDASKKAQTREEYEKNAREIKKGQLIGCELDLKMWTLASSNMILRGDGSSKIFKGDSFLIKGDKEITDAINAGKKPNKGLLNPPFSYSENGMPFVLESLNYLEKNGRMALIIQESSGSGKSVSTNKKILENNTLLASIHMPGDLFEPSAGVQTSIYVFESGVAHDINKDVMFIDFSDDGYKRTGRGLSITGDPDQRYEDLYKTYKYGKSHGDIELIKDTITLEGNDWNYNQHRVIDIVPTEEDFMKTIGDFLTFEISRLLEGEDYENN